MFNSKNNESNTAFPRDLLYRINPPYYCEDGIRLELSLYPGITNEKLFSSIIDSIRLGMFDGYLNGQSFYPSPISFSALKKVFPWEIRSLKESFNGAILIQERNNFPNPDQSIAFFYCTDAKTMPPYLHLYEQTIPDVPRLRVLVEPWCADIDETIDSICKVKLRYKK